MMHIKKQDPEVFEAMFSELKRQSENLELIASENFVLACGAGSRRIGSHQQVCRRLSLSLEQENRQDQLQALRTLLRRLRVCRCGRATGDRTREGNLRCRARQRPAALRFAGQHGGVFLGHQAGRHHPQPRAFPRRSLDPRASPELLRFPLQHRALRRGQGHRGLRLRQHPQDRARGQAAAHPDRRQRVSAHHRFQGIPQHRG